MRRVAKFLLAAALICMVASLSFAIGLLIWSYSQFPSETSPPDPSSVPPVVLDGFAQYFGANPQYASRLFLYRDNPRFSQLTFTVVSETAYLWVSALWSPPERVAEIAQRGYFGHGFEGVEHAAQGYFGRSAAQLSPEEVAALVLVNHAPSSYSPWCHRERFRQRAAEMPFLAQGGAPRMLQRLLPAPAGVCGPAT